MIRQCQDEDFDAIYKIINESATAYKGIIPTDRWKEPYMPKEELLGEISGGVIFWGYEEDEKLIGVMGIQDVIDVTLIRHSYVLTERRNQGIGGKLLSNLIEKTDRPILIGTWADSVWAVKFYEKYEFSLVTESEKNRLLMKYWKIPGRQVETSVVLGDRKWFDVSGTKPQGL